MVSKENRTQTNKALYALPVMLLALLVCGFASITLRADSSSQGATRQANGVSVKSRTGEPLTKDERDRVVLKTLAHPRVANKIKGHRVRALRVTHESTPDATSVSVNQADTAFVTLFDYNTGRAIRYVMDLASGDVLSEQPLTGHPQSSKEERDEAAAIIERDPELSALLQSGQKMIGGFIVEAPAGAAPSHRYMHMRIVTEDMTRTSRVVIVDLSDEMIRSKQQPDN